MDIRVLLVSRADLGGLSKAISSQIRQFKPPRQRTSFTSDQLQALEHRFQLQQYIVGQARINFAESLGLNEAQVKVWFQNRRIKWRKEQRRILKEIEKSFNNVPK